MQLQGQELSLEDELALYSIRQYQMALQMSSRSWGFKGKNTINLSKVSSHNRELVDTMADQDGWKGLVIWQRFRARMLAYGKIKPKTPRAPPADRSGRGEEGNIFQLIKY